MLPDIALKCANIDKFATSIYNILPMIDYIIRGVLGEYGRIILDFWLDNNLLVSSILLAYGIFIIISNKNLQKMAKKGYELLGKEDWSDNELTEILNEKDIDFWNTIQESSRFPFISLPLSVVSYRVTQTNLKTFLTRYFLHVIQQKKMLQLKKRKRR